jgi:hypothetical protein
MDVCMSDNPLDGIPAYNRVSIRAVLVHGDEDPGPALAAAGITDPIAIPVVMGEDLDLFGGMLGDGITPNLTAVLETEAREDFGYSSTDRSDQTDSQPDAARPASPFTTTAPLAFGMRSFAPIGRLGDTRSGRYGNNTTGFPPSPGESLEIDRILTSGRRNLYPSAGHGRSGHGERGRGGTALGWPERSGAEFDGRGYSIICCRSDKHSWRKRPFCSCRKWLDPRQSPERANNRYAHGLDKL